MPGVLPQTMLPLATPPTQNAESEYRRFGDSTTTRKLIYDNALAAAQNLQPVQNQRYTLALGDVRYEGPENFTIAQQKDAILNRGTLGRMLRGTWTMSDNATGDVVASRQARLGSVPYLTDRGTFINRGNEYTMANQMRLRPGAFARIKDNGELETHVNFLPGKGRSHRIFLEPKTGIFKMNIGQANIPLITVMRAMGVTDDRLREAWGNDLAAANMSRQDPRAINKLYDKLARGPRVEDEKSRREAIAEALRTMELDPETTERTLGRAHKNLSEDAILDITRKLLRVNAGEEDPDDRDALEFQTFVGPEDTLPERITKGRNALRQLLWKATAKGNLDGIPSGFFDKMFQEGLMGSGLGMPLEEINPAEVFDQASRVTRMGEGGIPSMDAVPDEARAVQPSQFGFIDFLRTPECYDRQTEVMTRRGWVSWPDVQETDEFACLVAGRLEYHSPEQLIRQPYKGKMYGADTGRVAYLVTPNHRLWVSPMFKGAQYRVETADVCHGSFRRVCSGGFGEYVGREAVRDFCLPQVERRSNNEAIVLDRIPIGPWAELVGWWLGEGNYVYSEVGPTYNIKITQSRTANPANCDRIEATLRELPFAWSYSGSSFTLATKQLAAYFRQFGGSHERYIPDYLLEAPLHARRRLYEALLLGEGRRDRRGDRTQFCTTSERLADDFIRLAFGLGFATRKVYEPDTREQSTHGGAWVVHIHKHNEHQLLPNGRRGNDYYTVDFDDEVFCATVPGGLLYVRRGDTVGHWSGNSGKVGVDLRLARGARKGKDGRVYTEVNTPDGGKKWVSPQDLSKATLAFPGELRRNREMVAALRNGEVEMVPRNEVHFELPYMENSFSPLGNMVPMKSMVKGQRAVMAARMMTQALPLVKGESPLVQSGVPDKDDWSFEQEYSDKMGAVRADQPGVVQSVDENGITVRYQDGSTKNIELYNNFPFNRKTFIHQTPTVQVGQSFKPGDLLARSNFTDEGGTTALGANARVAYVPFKGLNFEDANVISQSMADRLSSEHMYQNQREFSDDHKLGKKSFISLFPAKYDRKTLDNFDENGVIRPGTEVKQGDPLILAARSRPFSHAQVHRGRKPSFIDDSVTWEHHKPGIVTDVSYGPKGASVVVKSTAPMQVGDKLSGRYGDKGVISAIIPDDEMPKDAQGRPYEVLLNPLGIISRTNPAQIVETALGKIAEKTGKPYKLKDFEDIDDAVEYALEELKKHGMNDLEDIIDPSNDRKIPSVLTGSRWFMKLHHTAEGKAQGRGLGAYTAEGTPAKGGETGAKRIGLLELNSLMSHGATDVIRDASLVRGQASPEYWSQFMSGFKPPTPKIPHVYEKFVNQLKGSGINVVRDGGQVHIMALRDKDIDELAGDREIGNADTVDWRAGLKPKKGGLFDEKLTGGHGGKRWSYIKLAEPMPNPVMEEPIRRVLGLTKKKLESIIAGEEGLAGTTGPRAVAKALESIDLDKELARAREDIKSGKRTARDAAIRKLGYLKSAQRLGIHPREWMLTKAPVLPPAFRPVSTMGPKKLPMVADPNFLYKELFDANKSLRDMTEQLGDDVGEERLATYKALRGVTGLGDPIHPRNQERKVKGILKHVFGNSPKVGVVQRRLLGSAVDLVGRSVITPNPDLDMDHVGIPESKAWEIYKPFIVRNLVRQGTPRLAAVRAVDEKSETARKALLKEMESRPVIINRAPTLHRYGVMASYPKLVKGDTLQISPLVVGGFGADFDGDAMNYHVPSTDEAAIEAAEKMLPSRNLLSAANFGVMYRPSQEYVGGLYEASAREDKLNKPLVFQTKADAIRAFKQGRANVDRQIVILED